ncbi:hypothetical protein [Flavobacterium sp. MDT1-60]|uniref:hypothetical protein n=1 Tax=Flavobacterium sp. MDT1-60 TaxID=1979344 RepID=UPI00178002D5|nr:hypothetical protein [Flavobacterium sp. MDT1-60]QOG01611.1 hypothetical protein IHE43_17630 [Flavobacterium sp. MDT1-60]
MKKLLRFSFLISFFLLLFSCASDSETPVVKSSSKDLITFEISNIKTSIDQVNNKITVVLPPTSGVQLEVFIKTSEKSKLNVPDHSTINLSIPTEYIVTAEDGTTKKYIVEVIKEEGIKSFTIKLGKPLGGEISGKIDVANKTITVELSKDMLRSFPSAIQTAVFETTPGITTNLVSGNPYDTTNPTDLIITKSNGAFEIYHVLVKGTDNNVSIISFPTSYVTLDVKIYDYTASNFPAKLTAGLQPTDRIIRTLDTENISNVVLRSFSASVSATVSPDPSLPQNFNQDITYTITSETGLKREVKLRVLKDKILISGEGDSRSYQYSTGGSFFRYIANSKITAIKFINETSLEEGTAKIGEHVSYDNTKDRYISFSFPETTKPGKYIIKVVLETGDEITTYYKISLKEF